MIKFKWKSIYISSGYLLGSKSFPNEYLVHQNMRAC